MQEATFLILTALAGGSQHGYGIITDVEQISEQRVRLRAGTLYTALERLRADGLVEVDREEIVDSRLRRYYRLTATGAERLASEAARLRGTTQGQRWPRAAEVVDLLASATSTRLRNRWRMSWAWEYKHWRVTVPVRVLSGIWLVALTAILYGYGIGGWWGVLLIPVALAHFYVVYRTMRHRRV